MISIEEIKKMAELARIEISDEETESLRGEMDSILDYVKLIQQFHPDEAFPKGNAKEGLGVINVLREDTNPTESQTHNKELIAEFPNKEGDYLKVKKIL